MKPSIKWDGLLATFFSGYIKHQLSFFFFCLLVLLVFFFFLDEGYPFERGSPKMLHQNSSIIFSDFEMIFHFLQIFKPIPFQFFCLWSVSRAECTASVHLMLLNERLVSQTCRMVMDMRPSSLGKGTLSCSSGNILAS